MAFGALKVQEEVRIILDATDYKDSQLVREGFYVPATRYIDEVASRMDSRFPAGSRPQSVTTTARPASPPVTAANHIK
jgi:hypothetical protein